MDSTATDQPAPGDLAIVQRFVNTADLETGADELGDPEQLAAWLRTAGLAEPVDAFDEAGRSAWWPSARRYAACCWPTTASAADPDAIAVLDRAARDARVIVAFDADGNARLAPAGGGVDGVLPACSASSRARRPRARGRA